MSISNLPDSCVRRLYRKPAVLSITGFSSATLYRRIKALEFPAQISTGGNTVAWDSVAVHQWVDDCLAQSKGSQS